MVFMWVLWVVFQVFWDIQLVTGYGGSLRRLGVLMVVKQITSLQNNFLTAFPILTETRSAITLSLCQTSM